MNKLYAIALFTLAFTALVSGYTIDGDTVIYENQYGRLTQTPHTLKDFAGDVVINATSYFNETQSLDFALGFENGDARPTKAWKWTENVAHQVPTYCNVSYSKQCDTSNFTYTTNPKYAWCYDDNSTVKWEHSFVNGWAGNKTIEWFQNEKACSETQYWDDWVKLSKFNVVNYNDVNWYKVSASFDPNETKSLKVNLAVTPRTSGKYDLLIKRTSDTWEQAFTNGKYARLDPWYNDTWELRVPINVSDGWNLDRILEPVNVNITGLYNITNCTDGRLTWVNGTADENDHDFMILDNGANGANASKYCFIQFPVNLTAVGNSTYSARNFSNYYFYFANTSGVSRGDTPDLKSWNTSFHYNAWVDPESDGWTIGAVGVVQNYTYPLANSGNSVLQINDTVNANYVSFYKTATLATTRTWEARIRFISNVSALTSATMWQVDGAVTRRGMGVMNDRGTVGHPDLTGQRNYYAQTPTSWKVYRFVTDSQGQVYTIFEDGVNSTWGSNETSTVNGAGSLRFGSDWGVAGNGIYEFDYVSMVSEGYFPPLIADPQAPEGNQSNATNNTINVTVFDEQTGAGIFFDLDVYNDTALLEYTNTDQVNIPSNDSTTPQGVVRIDASNSSYYGRSRLLFVNENTTEIMRIYLINSSAVDVIATRFHIRTQLDVAIDNATVKVERNIGGDIVTIGELLSDFNGDALFYLEVNAPYFVTVTHPNYNSFFGQVNPSTTDYTITLTATGTNVSSNYSSYTPTVLDDIYWYLSPFNRRIWNQTTNITFYVLSTTSNLTYWGMNISNSTNSSIYFQNSTSVNGGVLYYLLNISDFNTSAENISVYLWIHRNPEFNLTAMFPVDFNWEAWFYPHSLVEAREVLYESGLSDVGIAMFVLFITMFIVAWISRMNPTAGLIVAGIILSFFAFSGVFDYNDNGVLIVSGIGVFVIALATSISLIYLRSPS